MKQFWTILGFELKNFFKNKIFVGVTVFLMLLIACVMFFPRILSAVEVTDEDTADTDKEVMLLVSDSADDSAMLLDAFSAAFLDYDVQLFEGDDAALKQEITSGEAECAFVFDSLLSYTYCVDNLSMYDSNAYAADEVLQSVYRMNAMIENGISADEANQILTTEIVHTTESLGKDQMQNYWYTYIMLFALYMVIMMYGQMIATNVATEKSSRAMEVLITSAKPVAMMFGKVIASCIAGLVQVICIFGSALLFYRMNSSYWGENGTVSSIFNIPLGLLGYMILFLVLGFFLYAFLYGAIGSTASKLEDINTSVMPITMLFIIAFIVVMSCMGGSNVDNPVMVVCSYVPFTSPMAMFARIAMSTVPAYKIAISVAILAASVCGVGVLSAKIYRVGVLLYGTSPKLGEILKMVRKA
jgi:ABC-2 type transport system permease protein